MAEIFINADTGDNSTGDGSTGSPWETLAYAFDQSSAGDTITCQDSTATYAFVTDTFDHAITIQGEQDDASGAVFDGGGLGRYWLISSGNLTLNKITFQNFDLDNNVTLLIFNSAGDFVINNCVFHDMDLTAGYSSSPSGCLDLGVDGSTCSINNSVFYDLRMGAGDPGRYSYIIHVTCSTTITMTGCTVYIGADAADTLTSILRADHGSGGATFEGKNNIFAAVNTTPFYSNRVQSMSVTNSYSCGYNVAITGTGVISSDPLFVDAPNGDFRLRPTSPCIDTGTLT